MNLFSSFNYENVRLIKQNGSIIDNIKALVQPDMIFVNDASICFDEGDIIERKILSGKIEAYKIIDPVFYEAFCGEPAHYQIKVKKTTALPKTPSIQINASGNAKVLVSSVDNSVNISSQDLKVFDELIDAVKKELRNNGEIVDLIVQMKNSINDKESFKNKYKSFMQIAADHMNIIYPFISVLSKFL